MSTGTGLSEEIARLQKDLEADEEKLLEKYEDDVRQLQEKMIREIEQEKKFIENCTEIEIGKEKELVEAKIEQMKKERYKDLSNNLPENQAEDNELMEFKLQIEREIELEQKRYEKDAQDRRARFDQHMKRLMKVPDTKRIEYLKKEIVPLVKAKGMIRIADETILETRYNLRIVRHAIRSGQSWALYTAHFQQKPVVCKVSVFAKIPVEIRLQLENASKCQRFLCSKPLSDYFIRLHEIFVSDQKMYLVMDEENWQNIFYIINRAKRPSSDDFRKWYWQICDALNFMHNYAIAHLNVKLENIVVSSAKNIKIVGLSRAFCYFNLDQEKFIQAPKVAPMIYYDHLPPESFDGNFDPMKADCWSFGYLMFEAETGINPRRVKKEPTKTKGAKNQNIFDLKKHKHPTFAFDKVKDVYLRQLIKNIVSGHHSARPSFLEISSAEYFQKVARQSKSGSSTEESSSVGSSGGGSTTATSYTNQHTTTHTRNKQDSTL